MEEQKARFSIRELIEAGFHFGHQTNRWNPKMAPYIHSSRNKIHIINLEKTVRLMRDAFYFVREVSRRGGRILFVGTKRQAMDIVMEETQRCGQFYINHRWLGGTLTNWETIQASIRRLKSIERSKEEGGYTLMTKKEALNVERLRMKLERALGGIKNMDGLPDVLIVTDTKKESLAVREANKLKIPVVALVDTNCDPDDIDWIIPGNDDAIRSLRAFCRKMSDAVMEGRQLSGEEVDVPHALLAGKMGGEEMMAVEED